jgi:hypothetical protein
MIPLTCVVRVAVSGSTLKRSDYAEDAVACFQPMEFRIADTLLIAEYLNVVYPLQMSRFERSPAGVPVVQRTVQNDVDEQTQIVRDIKHMVGNERIKPGSIVILLNSLKEHSCLAGTKKDCRLSHG